MSKSYGNSSRDVKISRRREKPQLYESLNISIGDTIDYYSRL